MKKRIIISIAAVFILLAPSLIAEVVINEVFYDPQGTDTEATNREFIELYNNGSDPVYIGYRLLQIAGPHWKTTNLIMPGTIVPAYSYLLIAEGETFGVTPDLVSSLGFQNGNYQAYYDDEWHTFTSPVDGVRLVSGNGATIYDCLLYNDSELGNQHNLETTGAATDGFYEDVPSGSSISRVTAGYDSNLLSDWETLSEPSPNARGVLADTDGDGLLDVIENHVGCDPNDTDSDDDGLLDGEEMRSGYLGVGPNETFPLDPDSDDDGLWDGLEVNTYYSNPRKADTDGDSLEDGPEVNSYGTSPTEPDTDFDGYADNLEVDCGTDPTLASSHPGVVINEVYYDHPGSDDRMEFINLYNPESYDVDISGFRIESAGLAFKRDCTFPEDSIIPAGCFYMIGEEDALDMNGNPPDLISWLDLQNGDQNDPDAYYYGKESPTDGVRLTGPEMKGVATVIDTVLWEGLNTNDLPGDAHDPAQSDEFIPDVDPGSSIRRKVVGHDTDNKSDWEEVIPVKVASTSGTDPDSDGLTNTEEGYYQTSAVYSDSDNDGVSDYDEIKHGYDPNDSSDVPGSDPSANFRKFPIKSGDFNGDGTPDISIFRPSTGLWAVHGITRVYYGTTGDIPMPADYDGDGTSDITVFRPSSALWASRDVTRVYFGTSTDLPVPGDYDGNDTSSIGIFRPSTGLWAIRDLTRVYFGNQTDIPVPADYGGGSTYDDIAIFRPSTGLWSVREITRVYFGQTLDLPVPEKYRASAISKIGVFRERSGLWALRGISRSYFGTLGDMPVQANWSEDSEIGIFRPSTALWAIKEVTRVYFGQTNDMPMPMFYRAMDSDSDGLPDWWEEEYEEYFDGLNENPQDDYDADGLSNLEEYQDGTDPTDQVAYWPMDENTGAWIYDSTENNNHGEIDGAVWVNGISGYALSFNGQSDYVDCGDDNSLRSETFTVATWMYHSAYTGMGDAVIGNSKWFDGHFQEGYVMRFWQGDTAFRYILGSSSGQEVISTTIPLQRWTHVAMSYDGESFRAYKNGAPVGSSQASDYTEPTQNLWIGRDHTNNSAVYFNGIIDETRIYHRALTATEIENLYNMMSIPPTPIPTPTPSTTPTLTPTATPTPWYYPTWTNEPLWIGEDGITQAYVYQPRGNYSTSWQYSFVIYTHSGGPVQRVYDASSVLIDRETGNYENYYLRVNTQDGVEDQGQQPGDLIRIWHKNKDGEEVATWIRFTGFDPNQWLDDHNYAYIGADGSTYSDQACSELLMPIGETPCPSPYPARTPNPNRLWIGNSGITKAALNESIGENQNDIEIFCHYHSQGVPVSVMKDTGGFSFGPRDNYYFSIRAHAHQKDIPNDYGLRIYHDGITNWIWTTYVPKNMAFHGYDWTWFWYDNEGNAYKDPGCSLLAYERTDPTPPPTPTPSPTPLPCHERLWVGHSYDARLSRARASTTDGWGFAPYSDENGYIYDSENIPVDWGHMTEDYDNNYFSICVFSEETNIDVRAGDQLKVWYDDSSVWVYFTGVESWEPARIWGEEDEIGDGGFVFYVDVNGNTYYDPWCCQTAYYNTPPTQYPGWWYDDLVPDTLDIAERGALAINAITRTTEPGTEDPYLKSYFNVNIDCNPPLLRRLGVHTKQWDALTYLRSITGSVLNLHVDQAWSNYLVEWAATNYLFYINRYDLITSSRALMTILDHYLHTRDLVWKDYAGGLVDEWWEYKKVSDDGSYYYMPDGTGNMKTGWSATWHGWMLEALVHYNLAMGDQRSRTFADGIARYIKDHAQIFDIEGHFIALEYIPQDDRDCLHFHHNANSMQSLAWYAWLSRDPEYVTFVSDSYYWAKSRSNSVPFMGYYPEYIGDEWPESRSPFADSEVGCNTRDMMNTALLLSRVGAEDYWGDIDSTVRNMYAESQMLDYEWIYEISDDYPWTPPGENQSGEEVPERCLGDFAGYVLPNDLWRGPDHDYNLFMHCCLGNGARSLYTVWENILDFADGKLQINLLLNRASKWVDIHSYLPYKGQVDLIIKKDISNVSLRIPGWVTDTDSVDVAVNWEPRNFTWVPDSRYIDIGGVNSGDTAMIVFGDDPLSIRTETAVIGREGNFTTYTMEIKGNTIVSIEPPGTYYPLFNRQSYLENDPPWTTVSRFIPEPSPPPSPTPSPTPWGYKTPTPSPSATPSPVPTLTPLPCHERLWVGHSYNAWIAQTRSQLTYGWFFSPYSDENGSIYDNENISTDWGWMWEDYDNNYFSVSIWSDETTIDVRAGDHLKIWYDDSAVWMYLTGVEDWEQARIWGDEGETGEGGFAFYVDVAGNTYYDQWCCQTAYYNTAPTPIPTPTQPPIIPYAIWHMDTCTGDWIYDSGSGHRNGEIQWAAWTTGLSGCALDFDGVDDYVDINDPVDLESFTLSAWVWGRELGRFQRVLNGWWGFINFRIDIDNYYELVLWDGSQGIPVDTEGSADYTLGTWHHMVSTYDHETNNVKIYVDGIEAVSDTVIAVPKPGKLCIGGNEPHDEYFNGIIDEVCLYNEVLSASAIWDLYFQWHAPTPSPTP